MRVCEDEGLPAPLFLFICERWGSAKFRKSSSLEHRFLSREDYRELIDSNSPAARTCCSGGFEGLGRTRWHKHCRKCKRFIGSRLLKILKLLNPTTNGSFKQLSVDLGPWLRARALHLVRLHRSTMNRDRNKLQQWKASRAISAKMWSPRGTPETTRLDAGFGQGLRVLVMGTGLDDLPLPMSVRVSQYSGMIAVSTAVHPDAMCSHIISSTVDVASRAGSGGRRPWRPTVRL